MKLTVTSWQISENVNALSLSHFSLPDSTTNPLSLGAEHQLIIVIIIYKQPTFEIPQNLQLQLMEQS